MFNLPMDIKELSDEDVEFINFAHSLINSARYPNFQRVTDTYNKMYGTKKSYTSCGTCIRQQILDMKRDLDRLNEKLLKDAKETDDNSKEEDEKEEDENQSGVGKPDKA